MFSEDVSLAVDMASLIWQGSIIDKRFPKKHIHKVCEDIAANSEERNQQYNVATNDEITSVLHVSIMQNLR